jgi:drug/metabolite transporter (DMT)-like permease
MMGLYLFGMTLFGALGGLALKKVSSKDNLLGKLIVFMWGCLLYGLGAILNVLALRLFPYTIVFPLTALTYVWTFLISYFYLKEKINFYKLIGLLLIIAGAFVIAS